MTGCRTDPTDTQTLMKYETLFSAPFLALLIQSHNTRHAQHIHDDENHTVGRRLLTLPSFELIPPNVERWKTSAPSVACACEMTLSICTSKIGRTIQNKT